MAETKSNLKISQYADSKYRQAAPEFIDTAFNIISDYPWTLSENKILRKYVPQIILTEYKLSQSGELSSLINSLLAVAESTAATAVLGAVAGNIAANAALGFAPREARRSPVARGFAAAGGAALGVAAAEFTKDMTGVKGAALAPYRGLYPAKPTGNTYIMPYLNVENMSEIAGTWRAADDTKIGNNLSKVAGGAAASLGDLKDAGTKMVGLAEGMYKGLQTISQLDMALQNPGAAQEKIKAFTPNDTGESINLTFYLYNTTKDISFLRKNWEFLFQFTYQNLPNRKSVNLLDPPCVYEVEVPGYKRFPVAAIESFKVTNEGTTRLVDINTGNLVNQGGKDVKIIPEAYKVTLKITSLLSNTRNLYYYMYDQDNKINVFAKSRL